MGALVQLPLISRIWALYNREIWVKRCVTTLYSLQVLAAFTVWIIAAQVSVPYNSRCQMQSSFTKWPPIVVGFSAMSLDCVLVALTLFKVIRLSRAPNAPSVLHIIIRDGAWAFLLVTATAMITQIFIFLGDWMLHTTSVNWLVTVFSFTTTRLILNMLQFRAESQQQATTEEYTFAEGQEFLTNEVPIGLSVFTQHHDKSAEVR